MSHIDPQHETTRNTLRVLGAVLLAVGSLTSFFGFFRFISLFDDGPFAPNAPNPAVSVLMFGGGGMLAMIGFKLLFLGFAGRILRYGMAETLPPTLDAARAATPTARHVAREITGGVREALDDELPRDTRRHHCGTENDPTARFCQGCGEALDRAPDRCPKCGVHLDPGDAFCRDCGAATSTDREV